MQTKAELKLSNKILRSILNSNQRREVMEINIAPEDIERMVKDSIMRAGFGKAVEDGIKKAFGGYDNPIDKELKAYVGQICRELITEHYSLKIKEAVKEAIEAKVTDEMINTTTSAAVERMARAAEESRY